MHAEGNRTLKDKWTVEYFVPHELHVSGTRRKLGNDISEES